VQVVRQDHNRIDRERMQAARLSHRCTQAVNMIDQRARGSIGERHREEKRSACNEIPTVPDHAAMLTRISLRSIRATNYAGAQ
jgi:hypothetical protein